MNRRLIHHSVLIAITAVSLGVAAIAGPDAAAADRLSIVSAYLCLFFLMVVLLIGPAHAISRRKPPANSYLRRDIGIWGALNGLLHFFLANILSMNYEYLGIFVESASVPPAPEIRSMLYSWGTILGYVIAVLFVILLALSNDRMLRLVGLKWWKRIQRASYLGFLFTCAHAFAFQVLESRGIFWIFVVLLITVSVLTGQGIGVIFIKKWRTSRHAKMASTGN